MRALSGASKVVGYGLSMLVLALAALAIIPAMIRASGNAAWGSAALGQSVGAVAAVAVAYGWAMAGPAEVARGDSTQRLAEYHASLRVRLALVVPAAVIAASIAGILAPTRPDLAVAGAATMTLMGLMAQWFFVGLSRPYTFLLVETLPRVAGTVAGIVFMTLGQDALVGIVCQAAGFIAAFLCSLLWITRHLRSEGAEPTTTPGLPALLRSRGDGLVASLSTVSYLAAPLAIVSVLAPAIQPVYALVDKLQRQIAIGLQPITTVLQGWVPRAEDPRERARMALIGGGVAAVVLGAGVGIFGRFLIRILGAGTFQPSTAVVVIMSVFVGAAFYEQLVAKVVLATYHRLADAARATALGAAIGLPLVAVGAIYVGAEGALAAVVVGVVVRLLRELVVAARILRASGDGR